MLRPIFLLLITARQIIDSHQCELHNQENDSHLSGLPPPCPFSCGGNVPGIAAPVAPAPALVSALDLGAPTANLVVANVGNAPLCYGTASYNQGSSINLGPRPINQGSGTINVLPGPINLESAALNVGLGSRIAAGVPVGPIAAGSVLNSGGPSPSGSYFNLSPNKLAELIATGAGLQLPAVPQCHQTCIRHALVPVPVQVYEECITNVPVIRKTIRHRAETFTRHVPILEKKISQQHEQIIRHVPVAQKSIRNVVETRIRHIPVIRSRVRTVVEPYTVHVPITERCTRPVEDSITRTVPFTATRVRPVVVERTRYVPVVERRCRPVVETCIQNVPTKRTYVRNVVERRVRPVVGPCRPCVPFYGRPERAVEQNIAESVTQHDTVDNNRDYQDSTPPLSYDEQSDDAGSQAYQSDESHLSSNSASSYSSKDVGPPQNFQNNQQSDEATHDNDRYSSDNPYC